MEKLGEIEITVIAGDFSCNVGSNVENYDIKHGGYVMKLEIRKEKVFWGFVQL